MTFLQGSVQRMLDFTCIFQHMDKGWWNQRQKKLNKTEFKIYDDVAGITLAHFQNHKLKSDLCQNTPVHSH